MIEFVLNDSLVCTGQPAGLPLLDFIRQEAGLTGTKTGCREGDCGACTVLKGELSEGKMEYRTIVSCLTPLGNVQGKHIVTIEGLNGAELTPVQEAISDHSATQCGFCTPGLVLSLTAFLVSGDFSMPENILAALDGNICRCTGYKSIERAAISIYNLVPPEGRNNLPWLVKNRFIPAFFEEVPGILASLKSNNHRNGKMGWILGGATDLMVQRADELRGSQLVFPENSDRMNAISVSGRILRISASVTTSQLMESEEIFTAFPKLKDHLKLISSTPIRNMATIAGNIVNASPIADLVVFFLALDAAILLEGMDGNQREVKMNKFYSGYKKPEMKENEFIREISFRLPTGHDHFNFEKVSKRRHLDIATVNSAMLIGLKDQRIEKIFLSAGGVAPIPLFLSETCSFLLGKALSAETILNAIPVLQAEIQPISDIRGTIGYKRLLLRQLFLAHFNELFPGLIDQEFVYTLNRKHEEQ